MAHAAEIVGVTVIHGVAFCVVSRVVVVDNDTSDPGAWCAEFFGGYWVQTSYNARIRGKFAGVGDLYDPVRDLFLSPPPYPSWRLSDAGEWLAPVPAPEGGAYDWDEDAQAWVPGVVRGAA